MEIEIHGFNAYIRNMPLYRVDELCADYLGVDPDEFTRSGHGGHVKLKRAFGDKKDGVFIRYNGTKETPYVFLSLKGSFFDNAANFRFDKLINFLSTLDYKPTQLDIAFNDDKRCLTKEDVKYWCDFSDDYCTGTLVRKMPPEVVTSRKEFSRIQLNKASSKVNFGTIYVRPATECLRFEIKVKDNIKILHLLDKYKETNRMKFDNRCKQLLVSCINFITAGSKKNRVKSKYKMTGAWKSFIESDVKSVNWSELRRQRSNNRIITDNICFEKRMSRLSSLLNSTVKREKSTHEVKDILRVLSDKSGFNILKRPE